MHFAWAAEKAVVILLLTAAVGYRCAPPAAGAGGTPLSVTGRSTSSPGASQDSWPPAPPAGTGECDWPWPPPKPAPQIKCVAHDLDDAAGLPGLWYARVGASGIDAAGNVMFWAYLDGPGVDASNDMALFYGPPGAAQVLMWESQHAPDMPANVVISSLWAACECLSQDGEIVLQAQVSGPGITTDVNDLVLYIGTPGDFHKFRQSGDPAPDLPGYYLHMPSGQFSPHGILRVYDYLAPDYEHQAIWVGPPDNLRFAYQDGMQAPGCAAGVFFSDVMLVVHNDAGEIGFVGMLYGPGVVHHVNDRGHWQGQPGALQMLSRSSQPAADMPAGVTYKEAGGAAVGLNAAGQTTELAFIQGTGVSSANDLVRYFGDANGIHVGVREGDPAPEIGCGVTVSPGSYALVNDLGDELCDVVYCGPGISGDNARGVEFGPFGARRVILRGGGAAPGLPAGTTLASVNGFSGYAAMNRVGDIVGPTQISGPSVSAPDKVVLWMWHHALHRWTLLLRSGSPLNGRTILAGTKTELCGFSSSGGGDGAYQGFIDRAMLAIHLNFTDGTGGVYRISAPVFADGDGDGDVDATDLRLARRCFIGVENEASVDCATTFDLDQDGDVDLADIAMVQQLAGP